MLVSSSSAEVLSLLGNTDQFDHHGMGVGVPVTEE